MSRKIALWLLLGIIIVGVLLRSYHLTSRSLWFDESFSWRLIQFPFQEMITRAAADVHPPFYYVMLRAWAVVFGSSVLSLRSFSVTLSALTIAAAYLFTSTAFKSRRAGLLAAALLAVSGWQIAFAWEARMYTLGTALALLSSWLLVRAVRQPSLTAWIYYAIIATLFAYTHYFSFFTLAAHALVAAGYIVIRARGRLGEIIHSRLFWHAGLAGALVVLLYVPWIPTLLRQNQQVQASFWVPAPVQWSVADTFYRFFFPTVQEPPHAWPAAALTAASLLVVVIIWIVLALRRRHRFEHWLLILTGAVPVIAALVTSYLGQSLYQDRFLVFANIFVLIAVAVFAAGLRPARAAFAISFILLLTLVVSFVRYWQALDIPNRPGVRGAVSAVVAARQADQPVVIGSPFIFFPADYYMRTARQDAPRLLSASFELAHFAGGPIISPGDIISLPALAASRASRLWVIDTTGFGGSLTSLPAQWVVVSRQTFPEVFPHQGEVIVTQYRRR